MLCVRMGIIMGKKAEERDLVGVIPSDSSLERQRRKEARRKKSIRIFFMVLFSVMILIMIYVFAKFFFRVRSIDVTCGERYSEEEILQASGVSKDEILFTVDEKEVEDAIQKKLPFIVSVSVKRQYPGTIEIKVTETNADFYVHVSDMCVVLSRELKVLDVVESRVQMELLYGKLLPVTTPPTRNAVVGEMLEFIDHKDSGFLTALLDTIDVCQMREHINSISAETRFNIRLDYQGEFEIKLGNTSDFETKLLFAKQIISKFAPGTTGTVSVEDPEKGFALVDKPDNLLP
ncbi:MAG: FtsQ-type POTRA domain-containing protein [Ruminococcaceae bacterium]|nr:FtsQ-type POTRA domain-containing protein [Oscillospiraceae bacterium]